MSVMFILVGVAALLMLLRRRQLERHVRVAARGVDGHRRHACGRVVRAFLDRHCYLAREVAGRGELRRLIEGGIEPKDLAQLLRQRVQAASGPRLGRLQADPGSPVIWPAATRTRHALVIGRSGSGKSTAFEHLVHHDLVAGHGGALLSPEPELFDRVLSFVPKERWDDIVYLDPTERSRPISFNPLTLHDEDPDLKCADLQAIIGRIAGDESGTAAPRRDSIIRMATQALVPIPNTTLDDFERLMDRSRPEFRHWVIEQTADERVRTFWRETYESFPRDAHLSVLNQLARFLQPRAVRSLLCAPGPSVDLRRLMDEGRWLFAPVPDGIYGEESAAIIGQFLVAAIQHAVMSRADMAPRDRRFFPVYIDEFSTFASESATSFQALCSRARKYEASLVAGHQHFGQLGEHVVRELLGNVHTVIAFGIGASDARRLTRELVGESNGRVTFVDAEELVTQRVGEATCRIGRSVLRIRTPPPRPCGPAEVREEVVRRSRTRYGSDISKGAVAPRATPTPLAALDPHEALS